jgi:hypothetical protein
MKKKFISKGNRLCHMALKVNQISFWKSLKDPKNWLFKKENIFLCNVKERFLILLINVNVFHI